MCAILHTLAVQMVTRILYPFTLTAVSLGITGAETASGEHLEFAVGDIVMANVVNHPAHTDGLAISSSSIRQTPHSGSTFTAWIFQSAHAEVGWCIYCAYAVLER
jgi:hypothetical protein